MAVTNTATEGSDAESGKAELLQKSVHQPGKAQVQTVQSLKTTILSEWAPSHTQKG